VFVNGHVCDSNSSFIDVVKRIMIDVVDEKYLYSLRDKEKASSRWCFDDDEKSYGSLNEKHEMTFYGNSN
jgi:hypothetical protein